jgi:hypothetical protein
MTSGSSRTWPTSIPAQAHFGRSPAVLGPEEIRAYHLYLLQERHASWSTFNQAV